VRIEIPFLLFDMFTEIGDVPDLRIEFTLTFLTYSS